MLVKQRQAARQRRKDARRARSRVRAFYEAIRAGRKPLKIRVEEEPKPARRGFLRGLLMFGPKTNGSSGRRRARG